jgi:hypothetical protein
VAARHRATDYRFGRKAELTRTAQRLAARELHYQGRQRQTWGKRTKHLQAVALAACRRRRDTARRCHKRTSRSFDGSIQAPLTSSLRSLTQKRGRPLGPLVHSDMDGFRGAFLDWLSAWESWVVTATNFIDVDENRVLVLLDVRVRSKTHQVEMPIEGANLLTLRDGKLARIELFFKRAQARETAGLRE